MPRVLAVADEIVEQLWTDQVHQHAGVDLIVAAGDLPFDYLEYLANALDRPLVFVPGNHDVDLSGYSNVRGLWTKAGVPVRWPGPTGAVNADERVVDVAGLRIAGLGGSIRYNKGPNQWTERQQARRARRVSRLAGWRRLRDGRGVDVLLTHSPPLRLRRRTGRAAPGFRLPARRWSRGCGRRLMLHGHIHPHGEPKPDRHLGDTRVVNVVGYKVLDVPTGSEVRDET